jgi:DNA-binding transcriptional regulator YhcF (GntR family)
MLPTVRQLAGDLGINFNTVAIAYRELEEQGLVRIRHGSGVEVCADRRPVKKKSEDANLRARLREVLTEMRLTGKTMGEVWDWLTEDVNNLWGDSK